MEKYFVNTMWPENNCVMFCILNKIVNKMLQNILSHLTLNNSCNKPCDLCKHPVNHGVGPSGKF